MELTLVFVLEVCGLALAALLARSVFGGDPGAAVRRVASAVGRATVAFVRGSLARAAAGVAFAALAVLAAAGAAGHFDAGLTTASGLAWGAVLTAGTAWLTAVVGPRAGAAVLVAALGRFDRALVTTVRAVGAVGVFSQALAVGGALAVLGAGQLLHADDTAPFARAAHAALALPGYALGAAVVALTLSFTSGAYAAAARTGERRAALLDAAIVRQESQNPALVSAVVGERSELAASAARVFASAATAAVAAVLLATSAGGDPRATTRSIAFPLLLWAFGLVANGAGLFTARGLEAQGAGPALGRGATSTAVVWLFGLVGAGYWLVPDVWPLFATVAALGLVGAVLASGAILEALRRRGGALRDAIDGARAGPAPPFAAAFGSGLTHAAVVITLIGVVAIAAERLGLAAGVSGSMPHALLLAAFGAMAWSPYALALDAGAPLAESARRIASMGATDADTQQRLQRLVDTQQIPSAIGRSHSSLVAGTAALTACLALAPDRNGDAPGTSGWLALFGVAWVLAGAAGAARRAGRGAREQALEIGRQLPAAALEPPGAARVPSYRACEELASAAGLAGAVLGVLAALAGPVVLGILWKVVYRGSGPRLAAEALATFVAGAAVTALGVALTVDGTRAVLAGARRANRPEGDPATYAASATGDALAEILGSAAGPAACSLALVAAALALFAKAILS